MLCHVLQVPDIGSCSIDWPLKKKWRKLSPVSDPAPSSIKSGESQVWISLQARRGGGLSSTLSGTALEFLEKLSLISTPGENTVLTASAVRGPDEGAAREAGESGVRSGDGMTVEVLCTGSLYAVAAALEAFGAEVR